MSLTKCAAFDWESEGWESAQQRGCTRLGILTWKAVMYKDMAQVQVISEKYSGGSMVKISRRMELS